MLTVRHVLCMLLLAGLLCGCGSSVAQPTREDVERVMRASWETAGDSFSPRKSIEFHDIKFGSTNPATAREVRDGVPPDGAVTAALVDFTVRTYYTDKTLALRRKREVAVYADKFGEWAVMIVQARGEDVSTNEPAQ